MMVHPILDECAMVDRPSWVTTEDPSIFSRQSSDFCCSWIHPKSFSPFGQGLLRIPSSNCIFVLETVILGGCLAIKGSRFGSQVVSSPERKAGKKMKDESCCVIYCHSIVFMVQATRLYNLLCYYDYRFPDLLFSLMSMRILFWRLCSHMLEPRNTVSMRCRESRRERMINTMSMKKSMMIFR